MIEMIKTPARYCSGKLRLSQFLEMTNSNRRRTGNIVLLLLATLLILLLCCYHHVDCDPSTIISNNTATHKQSIQQSPDGHNWRRKEEPKVNFRSSLPDNGLLGVQPSERAQLASLADETKLAAASARLLFTTTSNSASVETNRPRHKRNFVYLPEDQLRDKATRYLVGQQQQQQQQLKQYPNIKKISSNRNKSKLTTTSTTTTTTTTTAIPTTTQLAAGNQSQAVEYEYEEYEDNSTTSLPAEGASIDRSKEAADADLQQEETTTTKLPIVTSSINSNKQQAIKDNNNNNDNKQATKNKTQQLWKQKFASDKSKLSLPGKDSNSAGGNFSVTTIAAAAANGTSSAQQQEAPNRKKKKARLVQLPFIRAKNESICIAPAYLEFPNDFIGDKWRSRGLIIIHMAVVVYMFYALALVCERYFIPSLEEFAQRLNLSDDVAGATLMSAGSSAPELFTAILGVFIAKGDVGTGAIVGSAVFNILFVIGICSFVTTTATHLNWWPVLRDSVFYTFTVLVLILFIYDERVTAYESLAMLALYGLYITVMVHNDRIKDYVTQFLLSTPLTSKLISAGSIDGSDDVFSFNGTSLGVGNSKGAARSTGANNKTAATGQQQQQQQQQQYQQLLMDPIMLDDHMFRAALLMIIRHKRLFSCRLRLRSAAQFVIWQRQYKEVRRKRHQRHLQQQQSIEASYIGPDSEADYCGDDDDDDDVNYNYNYATNTSSSRHSSGRRQLRGNNSYKLKQLHKTAAQLSATGSTSTSIVNYGTGQQQPGLQQVGVGSVGAGSITSSGQQQRIAQYATQSTVSKSKFSLVAEEDLEMWHNPPTQATGATRLDYYVWLAKIPCNFVLYHTIPDCTLYPDKYWLTFIISITWTAIFSYVMVWMVTLIGYTLGIPDSIMGITFLAAGTSVPDAYSSIHVARMGMADMAVSNSIGSNIFDILIGLSLPWFIQTAIYPGVVATINSRGVIYSVILLFMSLLATIYLFNRYNWTLQPRLGLALLLTYCLFLVLTCMLEFNMFGHVNPPPCL